MRFLVAPDKFKGSLEARAVAESIAQGLRDVLPEAEIEIAPVADGGEGTAEILRAALGGAWMNCRVHDALGRAIDARYAWMAASGTAVIEMSETAGMRRLQPNESNLLEATTFGVGEMIRAAEARGAREIIVALGGSATNDGGFGLARALGFRFFAGEKELGAGPAELLGLMRISRPPCGRHALRMIAAADVRNPLLGPRGASRIFGPQKGATPEQIELLERALVQLADVAARDLGSDFCARPGAGAAGGLGFGLLTFCGAELRSGFEVVAEAIGLAEKIERADVVITGEGRLDAQTLEGKAPARVAQLAREKGKSVYAIVVENTLRDRSTTFDGVRELAKRGADSFAQCAAFVRAEAAELARLLA